MIADGEVVWSWHPLLVSSLAEASIGPTGCAMPFNPRGDGDKKELVAGESTKETVKTIVQGRPDDPPVPVVLPRAFLLHADHGCERAPGLPCSLIIKRDKNMASTRGRWRPASVNVCR